MKCLILAAGQGTRLRSVAASKPLAELNGAPLIEHVVRLARAGGATSFLVVTGYEAEGVEAFLPELESRIGVRVEPVRNEAWAQPNGHSVLAAADRLPTEFLLLMSDHLFDPAIVSALIENREAGAALTLAADHDVARPELDLDDATKLDVDDAGYIRRIGKTIPGYNAIDTGIFLTTPALPQAIRAAVDSGAAGSLSDGVRLLAEAGRARASDIGGRWWIDVDDEPAFARARREFAPA